MWDKDVFVLEYKRLLAKRLLTAVQGELPALDEQAERRAVEILRRKLGDTGAPMANNLRVSRWVHG